MPLLSVRDVMARLGFQRNAVHRLITSGQLAAYPICSKPGGKPVYRISEADLEAFLNRSRQAAEVGAAVGAA
jgi:hypothetical protein